MGKHIFENNKIPIPISIEKFAHMYIDQISHTGAITDSPIFDNHDFKPTSKLIKKYAIPKDKKREQGEVPPIMQDIYRSDLGELLTTYYFESKIEEGLRFKMPRKNIETRERSDMPGKSFDAIGYRKEGEKIHLLIGETKVSGEKQSPPQVVDKTNDSIYLTHKKHIAHTKNDRDELLQKITRWLKSLPLVNFKEVEFILTAIENDMLEYYDITLGCVLVRDVDCKNIEKDFGKMRIDSEAFEPHNIHFCILWFTESIEQTVQFFYEKVQTLIAI